MDLKRSYHGYSVESLRMNKSGSFDVTQSSSPSKFRRLLSQFVAGMSINLIMFNIGLALSYPTLVVPELIQKENDSVNSNYSAVQYDNGTDYEPGSRDPFLNLPFFKHYTMTDLETTWYVSSAYICQPIGSIIGGLIIGSLGRKRVMVGLNLFMFVACLLPFFSAGPIYMYLSNILFGIGIGCSEAPIATYCGECSQPSIRGIIMNLSQLFLTVSFLAPYLIQLAMPSWRWQALTMSVVPVLTFIVCIIVPESPAWLISKERYKDAEASLRWVRGWTTSDDVREELDQMTSYHLEAKRAHASTATLSKSTEELMGMGSKMREKVAYFFSPRMRKPFLLICFIFALLYITGMCTIRPYLVLLLQSMNPSMDANRGAMWVTFAGFCGNILSLCIMNFTGKRFIILTGLGGNAVAAVLVSLIKMNLLSSSLSIWSLLLLSFFSGYGIIPMPWILQAEMYPFKGRGVASGFGAAFSYLVGFAATKSYLSLTLLITTHGVFFIFAFFSVLGLIVLWFKLPETEGKTFQEIDQFYTDKTKE